MDGLRLAMSVSLLFLSWGDRSIQLIFLCVQLLFCCVEAVPSLVLGMPTFAAGRTCRDSLLLDGPAIVVALRSRRITLKHCLENFKLHFHRGILGFHRRNHLVLVGPDEVQIARDLTLR